MQKKFLIVIYCFLLLLPIVSAYKEIQHQISNSIDYGSLEIEVIKGGIGVSAVIRNVGDQNVTDVNWKINFDGGIILLGRHNEGIITKLFPKDSETIRLPLVIGFGKAKITVTVNATDADTVSKSMNCRLLGVIVNVFPGDAEALTVKLEKIASGFWSPTVLTHAGDNSDRLFVADLRGKIYVIENEVVLDQPFLDLSAKIVKLNPIYDERGLLGLEFHTDYENNGRFFVYYSAPKNDAGVDHQSIIAEYKVSDENPNVADPASEKIVMKIDQPESNHNGGQLAFGQDGYLYIGLGDGGGAGDQHGVIGNGQDINTSLGSILRIDVDSGSPYTIPLDNPFVGKPGLDEIYAYGFRNPYRFSFDDVTNRLIVADVGQDEWEELDIVSKGGNYGWRIMEGNHFYDPDLADFLGIDIESLEKPIDEYSHTVGKSVIGGYVYRGDEDSPLYGKYVFGDWSSSFILPRAKLYYLEETQPDIWIRYEFQFKDNKPLKRFILGFGEDEDGEIYVLTTRTPGSLLKSGEIWHIKIV